MSPPKSKPSARHSRIVETMFHTRMEGRVHALRERSAVIQILSDGECFLTVPRTRVPQSLQIEGTQVFVFLTTRYGHFGIAGSDASENRPTTVVY